MRSKPADMGAPRSDVKTKVTWVSGSCSGMKPLQRLGGTFTFYQSRSTANAPAALDCGWLRSSERRPHFWANLFLRIGGDFYCKSGQA
jgi:hypothetical protein